MILVSITLFALYTSIIYNKATTAHLNLSLYHYS
jgi:hypothetical protein